MTKARCEQMRRSTNRAEIGAFDVHGTQVDEYFQPARVLENAESAVAVRID